MKIRATLLATVAAAATVVGGLAVAAPAAAGVGYDYTTKRGVEPARIQVLILRSLRHEKIQSGYLHVLTR